MTRITQRWLLATSMLVGFSSAAMAQELAANDVESVIIVGQRAIMANSIARQRASDRVESVITRDAIGQLPDQNVAETTRRLTGVNVLDDQGEGRFIAVRGLSKDQNSASINGVRVMAPESDRRAVALDVVPSELVESISVVKTLTPDMDADTIGAAIQINTTKGFDRKDPFFSITGEAGYNGLNEQLSPKVGIDFALPVSDKLGFAGGASYNRRQTSTDNTEMADWTTTPGGVVYAKNLEYRDYDVVRTRAGFSGSVDFKPVESTTLYARALYSIFNDTEMRRRVILKLDGLTPYAGDDNTASFRNTTSNTLTLRRDLKDRYESQIIQTYQIGGTTAFEGWKFDYEGSFARSAEHEWHTQDPTRFEYKLKNKATAIDFTLDYSDLETTRYTINSGADALLKPSNYKFTEMNDKDGLGVDKEWSYRGDITRSFDIGSGEFEIKAGGKARLRNKNYHSNNKIYDAYNGTYTLADVAGVQTYSLIELGPLADRALVRTFNTDNRAGFALNADDSFLDNAEGFYDTDENVYAGYGMARYTDGPLMIVGGLRVEHTLDKVRGNKVDEDAVTATPVSLKKTYTDWLPSLSLRYNLADDMVLRAGMFRSVARPQISDMAPIFIIDDSLEGEFGNPDLNPYRAWNFDLSTEWYLGQDGVIQIGAFYKDISDFIVKQTILKADYPNGFNGVTGWDRATVHVNGGNASVKGIEFNYQQALTMLPGALDGVLIGFNYTYTDASGDIVGRRIPLPEAAKHTFNAMLGYEKGRWSLRGTAAYRAGYLDEVVNTALDDRNVKSHLQFDASVKYKLSDHVRLYADFVNLNNEPYLAYQKGPGRDRLLQYETYSWTGKFGVKMSF